MAKEYVNLMEAPPGRRLRITGIVGGEAVHRRLLSIGFHTDDIIELDALAIMKGPLLVRNVSCGSRVALGRGVAHKIAVEVLDGDA
jgi:Fe2+ transport system protein FeoA